ncbi:MAG: hypothetical protein ACPGVH_03185 [Chitinophagales bacterium]
MKILYIIFFSFLLQSCGLLKMLPKKPVLSEKERLTYEKETIVNNNEIKYSGERKTDFPVIPFQMFGITYAKDIVIVTKHPKWNMHEYAKLDLPGNKHVWLMKDSEEGTLDQFLTTNQAEVVKLLPEIPLKTSIQEDMIIDVVSNGDSLKAHFEYTNALDEKVVVDFENTKPLSILKQRNGSTMGHSKNQVAVLLDLPYRQFVDSSKITYNNTFYKTKKLLGLVSFQMLLEQTQGGLSTGSFSMTSNKNAAKTLHNKTNIEQNWNLFYTEENQFKLYQKNELRSQNYFFDKKDDHFFLTKANVIPWNTETAAFEINFFPALPDFRYYFEGKHTSEFIMDINGQKNHGKGTISAYWDTEKDLIIEINPTAPWWLKERPMINKIHFEDGKVSIDCSMSSKE